MSVKTRQSRKWVIAEKLFLRLSIEKTLCLSVPKIKMGALGGVGHKLTVGFVRLFKALESIFLRCIVDRVELIITKVYRKGGITINGTKPWDMRVHNKEFFTRVANNAPMGLGESYMDGMWDCDDICELTARTMKYNIHRFYMTRWNRFLNFVELYFFNLQTKQKAWEVGREHYDTGQEKKIAYFKFKKRQTGLNEV